MTLTCAVTRFVINTSTGSQNITTTDLGGLTPKAVIFIGTRGVTDGTAANHAGMSFGAATGSTNEWCIYSNSENGQGTSDTHSEVVGDGCILYTAPGTANDVLKADFTEFIADGCTINVSNANAAFLITAIFFAGSDLSAHANTKALADTVNTATDITDPGFEPDIVIASGTRVDAVGGNSAETAHAIGFCSNDGVGGVVQRSVASQFITAKPTMESHAWSRNDCIVFGIFSAGNLDWRGSLGTFDSNGFTITTLDAGANDADLCYLALKFAGGVSSWVGTHTTPTSTGDNGETGPGFTPQMVMRVMTQVDTVNTEINSGDASGTWGVSAMDADDEFAASNSDEDAVTTSNTQSLSDNVAIELPDDDGTAGLTATFVSFDTDGWTDNYSAIKGTGGLMPALAIEEFTAAAAVDPIAQRIQIPGTIKIAPSRDFIVRLDA